MPEEDTYDLRYCLYSMQGYNFYRMDGEEMLSTDPDVK